MIDKMLNTNLYLFTVEYDNDNLPCMRLSNCY